MTDAPDTDDPDAADDYAYDSPNATYNDTGFIDSQKSPYSLIKHNKYFKNTPNTKKKCHGCHQWLYKNIAADDDANDAPNTADDDADSIDSKIFPYILINCNHAPDAAAYDSAPHDSLIYSKLKHKIDPR